MIHGAGDRIPNAATGRKRLLLLAGALVLAAGAAWCGWRAYQQEPLRQLPLIDLGQSPRAVKAAIDRELRGVRADPRSGKAWGHLGLVLRAHDFGSEADSCLELAGRLDGREFLWPYIHGVSLSTSDPAGAMACFHRAALLRPSDSLPHFRVGEMLLQQGQIPEAVKEFRQALALEPESARARLDLARCSLSEGDLVECRRLAIEAARLAPGQRAPHELLVQVCRRLGCKQDADSEQQILDQLPPGEMEWEDRHVERVLGLRHDPMWMATSAQRLLDEGRSREAIGLLEELVAEDDGNPKWKATLAKALIAARDDERAAELIDKGIARHPDSADLRLQLGVIAFRRQDWQQAASAFQAVIRLTPHTGEAHYNLGQTLIQLNDAEGAIEAFRTALRFQPDLAAAHANLGDLLVKAGLSNEGLQHLQLSVKLDPSDASARAKLERAR
jgi:tetratricopeptide (TPR) repeat protein